MLLASVQGAVWRGTEGMATLAMGISKNTLVARIGTRVLREV